MMLRTLKIFLAGACLGLTCTAYIGPGDATAASAAPSPSSEIAYGNDALQKLDFSPPLLTDIEETPRRVPLILFVHGGGWSRGDKSNATGRFKAQHYTSSGYAFASMNYRLVPEATVEEQARDVAQALAELLRRRDELGIERGKVILMGHSAGAHLVALVGTDPQFLRGAGLSFEDVAGVIPIDGAAYDVPGQINAAGRFMRKRYDQAFGNALSHQHALSPTLNAAAPNAPSFLLLHVQRADGIEQAEGFETALRNAGTKVERERFSGDGLRGHMEINRRLGDPDYPATAVVDAWIARTLAARR